MSLPVRLDEDGAAAPPRENGELAFSAPWEGRLFGLTMTLVEAGRLDWEAFRQRLIARTAAWDAGAAAAGEPSRRWPGEPTAEHAGGDAGAAGAAESWDYWLRWREAFEDSLGAAGLVATAEIERLTRRLAARPHGHDHYHHGHDHHHGDHDHHYHDGHHHEPSSDGVLPAPGGAADARGLDGRLHGD